MAVYASKSKLHLIQLGNVGLHVSSISLRRLDFMSENGPMRKTTFKVLASIVGMGLGACLHSTSGLAADAISKEADDILRSMSDYLGPLKSFSFDYDVDTAVILRTGQKLQISASGDLKIRRPDGIYITRHGGYANAELYFDGKSITLYEKNKNVFTSSIVSGASMMRSITCATRLMWMPRVPIYSTLIS